MQVVSIIYRWNQVLLVAVLLLQLTACAAPSGVKHRYFWPPLSERPKLEYIGCYQSDADVRNQGTGKLDELIFGKERPVPLFSNPFGIYADGNGRLYVTEIGKKYVVVANLNKGTLDYLVDDKGKMADFSLPTGIDGDSQGNVYVVDSLARKISIFGPDNRQTGVWLLEDAVGRPLNLAVDEVHGKVFVVDTDRHQLVVLNLESGKTVSTLGRRGVAPGEFNYPLAVDLDRDGNVYVLDSMNARVQVFTNDGQFLRMFGERGTAKGAFQVPKGLAVSPSGQVYVTDSMGHHLLIFSLEGDYLMTLGGKFVAENGKIAPGGFYMPGDICADPKGGLWIVDMMNRMVHRYQFLDDDYLRGHPILPGQAVRPVE